MSRFVDRIFPVRYYKSDTVTSEIEARVFGAGFISISSWYDNSMTRKSYARSVLIDPDDIETLELALKEAKRRRNGHARRLRRKRDREYATEER